MLYELLTGRVFYDLPDGPMPPRYRVREVTFPLERPSAVAALPPAVDAVLLRALEQAPEARFATVFGTLEGARALFFHTPFEAGQVVLTADYPRPAERSPRAVLTGHPGKSLAQLLALHRREVEAMKAAGASPCGTWDRQAQLAATDAWYAHPDYFDV